MHIIAESWFVSLPLNWQLFKFNKVWGMQIIAHTFDFIFLGSDLSVISQDCRTTPPLWINIIQSQWGLIWNSAMHYFEGFLQYFGSFAAFSINLCSMFTPECKNMIFLNITVSPSFKTTLITGPSLPAI